MNILKFWILFSTGTFLVYLHLQSHYKIIQVYKERPVYWLENLKRAFFILTLGLMGNWIENGILHIYWLDILRHSLVYWSFFVLVWDYALNIRRDLPITYVGDSKGSTWDKLRKYVPWWLEVILKLCFVVGSSWFFFQLLPSK